MSKFAITYEKPTSHVGLRDWYAKQWELQEFSNTTRVDAFDLRNSGRNIRFETKIKTEWDTHVNNARLVDRITELSRSNNVIETLLQRLNSEIHVLKDQKIETENEVEKMNIPLQIVAQCISVRDCRRNNELTYDDADTELKKELYTIENVKKLLTERIQATWEKLKSLENMKFKLEVDLQDKADSIKIDYVNLRLDRNSADISYKPNSLRIPKKAVSYEAWLDNCRHLKLLADTELSDTYTFREAMYVTRERARNDIKAQHDATDFTLRKRIYQIQNSRNEMEWQQLKMQKEMEALLKEIVTLEESLLDKTNIIKCVETRLENRTYRSGFELCKDYVEQGLREEVLQLKQAKQNLINKIQCAKAMYNSLESLLMQLNKNLDDKQHSLIIDKMCLDMRSALKNGDRASLKNETDRNIVLTRLEKEIPPES